MRKHFLLFTLLLALMVPMAVHAQTVIPYLENFESYTGVGIGVGVTPTDWTVTTGANTVCEVIGNNSGKYLRIGRNSAISSATRIVTAELPSFSSNLRVLKLTFKLRAIHTSGSLLQVGYLDRNNTFQSLQDFNPADYQVNQYTPVTVDYNRSGIAYYSSVVIKYTGNVADALWFIDDVQVTFSVKDPNSLTATNVTGSSAYLSWSHVGRAEQYQVEYADNASFSNAQTVSTSTKSVTLTSLSSETSYYARVRSVYGSSALNNLTYSSWSNVASFTTPAPTCLPPTGLTVSGITSTGATFAWDAETGEVFQFFMRQLPYTYNEADFIHDGNEATYNGPCTYAVSFNPGTDNVFYLRKVCEGNDYSDPVSVEFHTPCEAITALGYSEYFDGYTVPEAWNPSTRILPSCWNAINTTTYSSNMAFPTIFNYGNNAYSGYNCLFIYSAYSDMTNQDPQPQYAIMPRMDDLGGIEVTLWAKGHSEASTFKIGTMTDPTDASTFTEITEQALTTSYQRYIYAIPANTTDQYIAFMIDAADSDRITNGVYIDNIVIPTCSRPTGLHVAELTAHSVRIEWDAEEGEMFQPLMPGGQPTYPFDPNNPPTTWNTVAQTENYAIWNTLSSGTTYGVWLRKYCSDSDQSEPVYIMYTTLEECLTPTNFYVYSDPQGVFASWEGNAPVYEIEYENLETWQTAINHGLVSVAGSNTYTFTGQESVPLIQGMRYRFRIKAQCTPSLASEWSDWFYYTDCPNNLNLPLHANFDYIPTSSGFAELPGCWSRINNSTDPAYSIYPLVENNQSLCHSSYSTQGLNNYNYIRFKVADNNNTEAKDQYLVFPPIDAVSAGDIVTLSFYIRKAESVGTCEIGLMDRYGGIETYQGVYSIGNNVMPSTYEAEKRSFTFTYAQLSTKPCIAIKVPVITGMAVENSICIDDIDIYPANYHCGEPVNVHAENIGATSASVVWEIPVSSGGEYGLKYKKASDDEWTIVTENGIVSLNYPLENLDANTLYDVAVRNNCNDIDHSEWVEATFTTLDVIPVPTNLHVIEAQTGSSWVGLQWECTPLEGQNEAEQYLLQVSEDGANWHGGMDNIPWRTLATQCILSPIDFGTHYVRVRAVASIDGEDQLGNWSEPIMFNIEACNSIVTINNENPSVAYDFDAGTFLPDCWTVYGDSPYDISVEWGKLNFAVKRNVEATYIELGRLFFVGNPYIGALVSFDWTIIDPYVANGTNATVQLQYCYGYPDQDEWQDAGDPVTLFKVSSGVSPVEHYTRVIASDFDNQRFVHLRLKYTITGYQGFENGYEYSCIIDNLVVAGREACGEPENVHASSIDVNSATVVWDVPATGTHNWSVRYRVHPEEGQAIEWIELFTGGTDSPEVSLVNLEAGTTYDIAVRRNCNEFDQSDWAEYTFTTLEEIPVPTNLSVNGQGSSWVSLSWDCASAGSQYEAEQYLLEISEDGINWHGGMDNIPWRTLATQCILSPIDFGTHYVRVRAVAAIDGENQLGNWSESIMFNIEACNNVVTINTENPSVAYNFDADTFLPDCWTVYGDSPYDISVEWGELNFAVKRNVEATYIELGRLFFVGNPYIGALVSFDWTIIDPYVANGTNATVQLQYCYGYPEQSDWMDAGDPIPLFKVPSGVSPVEHYTRVIASEYAQQKYVHLRLKYTIAGYQGFETGYEYSCIIDNLVVAGREACSNPTGCTSAIVTHNSARVAWNNVNDALNYDIRYRVASEMDWTVIEGVEGTVDATYSNILYYELTHLNPSTEYQFQVKSECANEWPTDVVTFTTQANPCAAPAIALADGYPKLSGWVQFEVTQNEGMTSCQVACKEGDDDWQAFNYDPQFVLMSVTPGTTYQMKVRGYCENNATWSDWSDPIEFTIPAGCVFAGYESDNWNDATSWLDEIIPSLSDNVAIEADVIVPDGCIAYANSIVFNSRGSNPTPTLTIADGGQMQCNENFTATMMKTINAYPATEGNRAGYYLISSPLKNPTYYANTPSNIARNLLTTENDSPTYDFYKWDYRWNNSEDEYEWRNYRATNYSMNSNLNYANGYLYANMNGTEISFEGTMRGSGEPYTKSVNYSGNEQYDFDGWNLVGNPFTCNAYLMQGDNYIPYYKMNDTGDAIVGVAAGTPIPPCEGVFVYCNSYYANVTFTTTGPSSPVGTVPENPVILLPTHDLDTHQDATMPVTVTIGLYPGWNWIAPTVEMSVEAMQDALVCDVVICEEDNTSVITPGQMVKVHHVAEGGTYPLTGRVVPASSVTIHEGNNWIGYIGVMEATVSSVFGGTFTPAEGDKIISQYEGFAIYTSGGWSGTLTNETLKPGQGYIYVSNDVNDKTITF